MLTPAHNGYAFAPEVYLLTRSTQVWRSLHDSDIAVKF